MRKRNDSRTPIIWVGDDGKGGLRALGLSMPTIRDAKGRVRLTRPSRMTVRIWQVDRHGGRGAWAQNAGKQVRS